MSRDYKLYLYDILDCCQIVRQFTEGQTFEQFSEDRKTADAVIRNLEIVGEAVKNIPSDVLHEHAQIEWKQIARFRDHAGHRYFGVRLTIVWDIVQNKIEELEAAVQQILESDQEPEN
ncbi:MAG: DUF86 domain-containing protein [Acidobacteria bacterium]|nr:DUF86 domain-containing protein [Acidobacteriota bacterium]